MDFHTFLIQLLNSIQYGLLLFLIASGLTLIFGIMGIINLAHGSFYMIGAYLAWSLAAQLGSLWAAIPVGIVLSVGIGMVLEWLLISRLYNRDHLYQVLLTYGLILMFEETRSVLWGDDVHGVPMPASCPRPITDTLHPVYRLGWASVAIAAAMYCHQHAPRMTIRAGVEPRWSSRRHQHQPHHGVRAGRRAGGVRRDDRGAGVVGVPRHGQPGADHLFRGRRHRRHRFGERRARRRAAHRLGRHVRQGGGGEDRRLRRAARARRDDDLSAHGGRSAVAARGHLREAASVSSGRLALWLSAAAAIALLAAPFIAEKYYLQLVTKILIMAIFAMSLDLLVGYTGLVSLGHAAFFGLAAYVLALLTPQYEGASLWTSLPIAMGAAAALALVIGLLVLRTTGIYFIMVTLAFAQMVYFVFHDTKIAGGSDGMYIYVRPVANLFGWQPFTLENFQHFYLVTLALFAAVFVGLRVMLKSPFGRVIVGIRVNEHRMRSLGYRTFRYKLVCFVIAGALAGLAGYLAGAQHGNVNPDMLGWHLSGSVLMMVILGGMGTLTGPIVGAFAMLLAEIGFQGVTKHWQLLMGGFVVLVALFLPYGLVGLAALASRRKAPRDE
jgi:branched-chain amino acid transport system permease protein